MSEFKGQEPKSAISDALKVGEILEAPQFVPIISDDLTHYKWKNRMLH